MAEKFTSWDDPYTGVNPFLPRREHIPRSMVGKAGVYLGGACVVVAKSPLVVAIGALYLLGAVLCSAVPLPSLRGPLRRAVTAPLARLLLLALGFLRVSAEYANPREVRVKSGRKRLTALPGNFAALTRPVDLLICTHSSFLEILFLDARFSPVFTAVGDDGTVAAVSVLTALVRAATWATDTPAGAKSLLELVRSGVGAEGPIAMFPEVAPTNARAVLRFAPLLHGVDQLPTLRAHLLAFSYPDSCFHPVFPAGSLSSFLFWILAKPLHGMTARMLPAADVPGVAAAKLEYDALARDADPLLPESVRPKLGRPPAEAWSERVRELLSRVQRTSCVSFSAREAAEFRSFFATGMRDDERASGRRRARLRRA